MFSREFHIENVMVIWDLIFADEQSYKTKDLQMLDYVSLAMFQYIREHLVEKEENDCFQRLFRYPPVESIVTIVELSKKIKGKFTKKQAFFPIQSTNNNTNKNSNVVSTKKANSTKVVNTNKITTVNNEPNPKTKINSNPKAQTDSNPKAKTDSTNHINSPKKPKNSMMDFLISRSNNNKGSNNQNDNNNNTKTNNEQITKKGADVKAQETPLPKSLITPLPNTNNQIEGNKNEISKDKNKVNSESKEEKTIIKLKQNEEKIISKNTNEQINLNKENLGNITEETINEIRNIFIKYKNNMEIDDVNKLEFLLNKLKK
jgi:hypothetical protein